MPELAGLAIFRSRQVEEGRERFRLHVGYFSSVEAAEKLLPVIRETYPAALITVAPQSNMGSLDDTAMARFSILQPIEPAAAAAAPAAPMPARPDEVALIDAPRAEPSPAPEPTPPVLTRADAVTLPAAPAVTARLGQHYAVQLIWSHDPIEVAKIPILAIYSGYLLYAVETEPGPRHYYGVRLGFYADALSARLVAHYVRSDFSGVSVVPVSDREMTRASTAKIRLGKSPNTRAASGNQPRWPAKALAVADVNLRKAMALAGL
ncbi:MAG TPA: hypothetical protein VN787_08405 [Steroidobacteraceae bacterium]|nr:hypothetical protein [Steroidobacteraceae bacterium]